MSRGTRSQAAHRARILLRLRRLENTKGGLIAGIGAIALLYVTIRLMMQIEKSLNDIWGVKTGRAILRKISDYLAIVLLCPLIIIVTTGATVYTTVRLSEMVNTIPGISDTMNALLALSSRALPIVTTWLIFSFILICSQIRNSGSAAKLP